MDLNDLTQRAPRSPRVRLGGFAILPRIIDKCRATLAGKQGEYKYACPLDQQFFTFVNVDPEAFKEQVKSGKGDGELLEWITANSKIKRASFEIKAWSLDQDQRVPGDLESRQFFNDYHAKMAAQREDIFCWFDLLDVDDYVSFGGKA